MQTEYLPRTARPFLWPNEEESNVVVNNRCVPPTLSEKAQHLIEHLFDVDTKKQPVWKRDWCFGVYKLNLYVVGRPYTENPRVEYFVLLGHLAWVIFPPVGLDINGDFIIRIYCEGVHITHAHLNQHHPPAADVEGSKHLWSFAIEGSGNANIHGNELCYSVAYRDCVINLNELFLHLYAKLPDGSYGSRRGLATKHNGGLDFHRISLKSIDVRGAIDLMISQYTQAPRDVFVRAFEQLTTGVMFGLVRTVVPTDISGIVMSYIQRPSVIAVWHRRQDGNYELQP